MAKELLCTLGPASMTREIIARLGELGASLLRVNLSHTSLDEVASTIEFIRGCTPVPVCLDTEGAQIRTGGIAGGSLTLRENSIVRAHRRPVPGDSGNFNFYPIDIIEKLKVGDFISIDFNAALVQVIGFADEAAVMRVLNGGEVGQNKAVTVERDIPLPALTEKDRGALDIGMEMGIRHYALSFASRAADVDEMRSIIGEDAFLISKIECFKGIVNLDDIAARSDALLIDRGDLSREVPLEQIPRIQKRILRRGRELGVRVYVATNLLESMVSAPTPTRAEVNDIYNTLCDGADGLVLAAETAIGAFPVRCATMIARMIQQYEARDDDDGSYRSDPASLLVTPHGGRLVRRDAAPADLEGIEKLPVLEIADTDLMDCEHIALGTYSPLTGFMDRETLESVLDNNTLGDGTVWTMPLVLHADEAHMRGFQRGDRIALKSSAGRIHALLDVTDVYEMEIERLARKWFGTADPDHPGVARLLRRGNRFVGGDVTLVEGLPAHHHHCELTPAQTRFLFTHKGWSKVVCFHGRDPVHRVHEYLQREALKRTGADGLYISPVIGPKKPNDFLSDPIVKSYQLMLESDLYPAGKVVLGGFSAYPRYCGPREAVHTALCRKNMGCSHFIVGPGHAGVGDFYAADADRRFFDSLGDIGITPVFFAATGYNPKTGRYEEEREDTTLLSISDTEIRESIRVGKRLPDWVMWTPVQDMLRAELAAGQPIFHE